MEYDSDGSMPNVNVEDVRAEVPKKSRKDLSKPPLMADTSNVSSNLGEVFPSKKRIDMDLSDVADANNILQAISQRNSKEVPTPLANAEEQKMNPTIDDKINQSFDKSVTPTGRYFTDNKVDMLRDLKDRMEIQRLTEKHGQAHKCNYKQCIVQTQMLYDKLCEEARDKDERRAFLRQELELRIQAANGKTPQEKKKDSKDNLEQSLNELRRA